MTETLLQGDCLKLFGGVPDHSIDLILADLPYGMTANKWDSVIPLKPLFKQHERVLKEHGALLLFGMGKFGANLIVNAPSKLPYRYDWVWKKTMPVGFLWSHHMPLRAHENIYVFYINEYGLGALSYELGYKNEREMLNDLVTKIIGVTFPITHIETKLMGVFNGISADDYAKKLKEKQWHLGDIVEDDEGRRAMIVKDHDGDYVLMNIIPNHRDAFNICEFFDFSDELSTLSLKNPDWHKVVED